MNVKTIQTVERAPIVIPKPGVVDYFWSTILWILGVAWIMPMLVLLTVLHWLFPMDIVQRLDRVYIWGQVRLLLCRWRAEIHPDVDPKQPYMFMNNHTNHFDHVTMYNATPHVKQGLELREHFKYPFYGWFMKARGTIPVDRGQQGQSQRVMDHMRSEIDKGHSILAFPEGTRSRTGHIGPLRRGTFFIARDLGIPIVPVVGTGAYEIMQKGSLILRPFKSITVHYLEPIPTVGITDEEIPALIERVHAALSAPLDAHWMARGHDIHRIHESPPGPESDPAHPVGAES
ncbi:MAG: lysophospholipid acyltransferase family protein [Myxococcota bacterium]|nr:lysophospholipid acyltransferase family protein [Myxococcota bacterium]